MSSDSDMSENDSGEIVPEAIRQIAKNISLDLLPKRSKQLYRTAYNAFKKWRRDNGSNSFCEDVLLAYFYNLSQSYASSSLWSIYSMLRTTIHTFDHVDISQYQKLITFLKKQHLGYRAKKSLVFTKEQISTFLNEAPNDSYLSTKVALIFGIAGALRRIEFTKLLITDITETEDLLFVRINETKNKIPRAFTITGGLYDICKQYMQARPQPCELKRFFLKYSSGKCVNQAIGINKFGSMPKEVVVYLKLPNAELYTGHSFRRTSATLLIDAGADITTLKRHGGWKSNTVAEGYIADSINNKKKIYQQITSGIVLNKQVTNSNNEESGSISSSVEHIYRVRSHIPIKNYSITNNSDIQTPFASTSSNCTSAKTSITETPSIQQAKNKNSSFETPSASTNINAKTSITETPSIQQAKNKNSSIEAPSASTNVSSTNSRTSIAETPSLIHKQVKSSDYQERREESSKNVTIVKGCISETSSSSTEDQNKKKFQIFYDADFGLCFLDPINKDLNKSYVFNNCNVSIQGTPDQPMIFNNCKMTHGDAKINDEK